MNIQPSTRHTAPATVAARAASPRSLNLDAGTYRADHREAGRGYGRSEGYGGPRSYVGQGHERPLFRIC